MPIPSSWQYLGNFESRNLANSYLSQFESITMDLPVEPKNSRLTKRPTRKTKQKLHSLLAGIFGIDPTKSKRQARNMFKCKTGIKRLGTESVTRRCLPLVLLSLINTAVCQDSASVQGTFRNMTSKEVSVYWADENGDNQNYLDEPIPAYGQTDFLSYAGTTWRAYHDQTLIKEYVATNKVGQVFLISTAPLSTPPTLKPPGITTTSTAGTEKFYEGSWEGSDCIAKLTWAKATGSCAINGMISNSQYVSPVKGSYDASTGKLVLNFDDNYGTTPDFTLIEGNLDGQKTWYDNQGFDLVEIRTGDVDVETFENIAEFMIGADENKVVAAAEKANLGNPIKGVESLSDAIGVYFQTWDYPAAGISLLMESEDAKGWKSILTITAKSPCKLKTLQGVGIGTSESQAKKAYSAYFTDASESQAVADDQLLVGSIYGGMILTFRNGVVSEIFLGPAAE